jgi:hypothetical protein
MSFSLAPHPIGIKWWKNLWHANKDLSSTELSSKITDSAYHTTHRRLGKYFYSHRAGPLGMKAAVVVLFVGVKVASAIYSTRRDELAEKAVNVAYGGQVTKASHH